MIERLLAADSALERGELDVAERLFAQVAGADPRNAIAVVGRARVAMRRESRTEAAELARRALEIDPDEAAALRLLDELAAPGPVTEPDPTAPAPAPPAPRRTVPRPWWRRALARILGRD